MSSTRLHLLTERLSSLMRANLRQVAVTHQLKLMQLEVLIYLSVANRYSDTPVALTEYFVVTKGTISQTLKALERNGFIEKWADPEDGRLVHCSLSAEGKKVVASAYPAGCFAGLSTAGSATFADSLEEQLQAMQRSNGFKTFGQCSSCRFYESHKKQGRCGLTGEALTKLDSKKICREHEDPVALNPR